MAALRAEDHSWAPPSDLDLSNEGEVRYWTDRLQVTPLELKEVLERVKLESASDSSFA